MESFSNCLSFFGWYLSYINQVELKSNFQYSELFLSEYNLFFVIVGNWINIFDDKKYYREWNIYNNIMKMWKKIRSKNNNGKRFIYPKSRNISKSMTMSYFRKFSGQKVEKGVVLIRVKGIFKTIWNPLYVFLLYRLFAQIEKQKTEG